MEFGIRIADNYVRFSPSSDCVDLWGDRHKCVCRSGFIGEKCDAICDKFNPCHSASNCTKAKVRARARWKV